LFLFRQLLIALKSSLLITEKESSGQTVVVASAEEYETVTQLLEATIHAQPLGRISVDDNDDQALCSLKNISLIENFFSINRIIFCIGETSLATIIAQTEILSRQNKRFLFHTVNSGSMIGSQTLAPGAEIVAPEIDFRITHPYQKRMKRLLDLKMSILFLLFFPLHFIFHPHPLRFIKNCFSVLTGAKTWIGYAGFSPSLPVLKPAIISSLGEVGKTGALSKKADQLYAKNYDWWQDFLMIMKHYKEL
jgi:hypothetical protein